MSKKYYNLAILFLLLITLSFVGCSNKNKVEDPLILPPNFNEMPKIGDKGNANPKENNQNNSQELKELKDLLLNQED